MIEALEAYLATAPPAAPRFEEPAGSGPGMTSARAGGSPAGAAPADRGRTRTRQGCRTDQGEDTAHDSRLRDRHGTRARRTTHERPLVTACSTPSKTCARSGTSRASPGTTRSPAITRKTTWTRWSTWSSTRSWEWTSCPRRWGRSAGSARRTTDALARVPHRNPWKPGSRDHARVTADSRKRSPRSPTWNR